MNDETSSGCVLFADLSGGTDFCDTVGDSAGQQAIELCVKLCTALTEQHGGRVVKAADDEVMAIFPDASAAGGVRIGMHYGPVDERDGEVFGDTVNMAARLTEMAERDQIVASLETVDLLTPIQKMDCRKLFSVPMKGKDDVGVCEIMWSDADDATQLAARRATTDAGERMRLVYRTRVVTLDAGKGSVVLGRESSADVVVAERKASRAHCEITSREGGFVLKDTSQNGTFLSIDGEKEVVLRGDETILRGHGFIALGQSRSTAAEFVEYFCE